MGTHAPGLSATGAPATMRRMPRALAAACGPAAALLVLALRQRLEADMAGHMLVEFPLLYIAGAGLWFLLPRRWHAAVSRCNRFGLTGFLAATLVSAYWMIPAALDAALSDAGTAGAKYASAALAGALLPDSFRAAPLTLQALFIGNWAWMTAVAGLLYQQAPAQLCLNYGTDAQQVAGRGLVGAAVALACVWLVQAAPRLRRGLI